MTPQFKPVFSQTYRYGDTPVESSPLAEDTPPLDAPEGINMPNISNYVQRF